MFLALMLDSAESISGMSVLDAYYEDGARFEEWHPTNDDVLWLYSPEGWHEAAPDVDEMCVVCDALLDLGDVDALDASQCDRLSSWLTERLSKPTPQHLRAFYSNALDMSLRAAELGSALIVEF